MTKNSERFVSVHTNPKDYISSAFPRLPWRREAGWSYLCEICDTSYGLPLPRSSQLASAVTSIRKTSLFLQHFPIIKCAGKQIGRSG